MDNESGKRCEYLGNFGFVLKKLIQGGRDHAKKKGRQFIFSAKLTNIRTIYG